MKHTVHIRPQAAWDLDEIHASLSSFSQEVADRTSQTLQDCILSLADFPRRYSLARESGRATVEIRQLVVGNYRILYWILGSTVRVVRVVHAAQQDVDVKDVF